MTSDVVVLEPVVSWPREVELGRSYLVTVDIRTAMDLEAWPYDEEQFEPSCVLDAQPYLDTNVVDDPVLVLHRFGGTYRPVRFVVSARQIPPHDDGSADIWLSYVNRWGVVLRTVSLPLIVSSRRDVTTQVSDLIAPPMPDEHHVNILGRITVQRLWGRGYSGFNYIAYHEAGAQEQEAEKAQLSYDAELDAVTIKAGGYNMKDDGGYYDSGWNVWAYQSRLAIRRRDQRHSSTAALRTVKFGREDHTRRARDFDHGGLIRHNEIENMQSEDLPSVFSYGHVFVRFTRTKGNLIELSIGDFRPAREASRRDRIVFRGL